MAANEKGSFVTAAELAALMERRAAAIETELQRATLQLKIEAIATSRKVLTQKIYAKPVTRRPRSGKPAWKRTGDLRRAERVEPRPTEHAVALVNDMVYAKRRHDLDYGKIRDEAEKKKRRAPKVDRTAHWRDDTKAAMKPRLTELGRAAILRALKGS